MFCIDLDRFKLVNDSLGHEAGDRLLVEVARRLRETLRAADTVARLGDDEFMVLCEECPDAATARVVAQRLNDALSAPVVLDGRTRLHERQHRRAAPRRAPRRRRGGHARRRRRDARRQAPRQGTLRRVRRRHARARDGAPRARGRPAARARDRRARPLLPADRRHPERRDPGLRGARALAAPGARRGAAERVPPDLRGDRPDRAARPPAAARRARADPALARVVRDRPAPVVQPVGGGARPARPARGGRRGAGRTRARSPRRCASRSPSTR